MKDAEYLPLVAVLASKHPHLVVDGCMPFHSCTSMLMSFNTTAPLTSVAAPWACIVLEYMEP
jgi:hypothetical protein